MSDIDFNLMPVFEALYEERRVGRAAVRLGLTQSAVSQALGRLRHALNDQLFLRSSEGLVPTARAQQLAASMHALLSQWRDACRPPLFDPATSTREFRIVAGSYIGEMLLPPIIASLTHRAANIGLRVWNMSSNVGEWLENGMIDMAIGTFEHLPKRVRSHRLFGHPYVWYARREHPTAFSLRSIEEVLALPRVELDAGEGPVSAKGLWQEGGIRRRAAADVQSMLPAATQHRASPVPRLYLHQWRVALEVVGKTDLLALMPERLAVIGGQEFGTAVLTQFTPVVTSDPSLIWDETQTNDPGNRWLRDLILETVGEGAAAR